MPENTLNLTDEARSIIKADVNAFLRDNKRYADYVVEMEVTPDTLPDHVAAFRDAFKAARPKADAPEVKAYATKVRNGLRYWVGKGASTRTVSTKYVTALGLKDADREAFLSKCAAEWDAAHADSTETATVLSVVA